MWYLFLDTTKVLYICVKLQDMKKQKPIAPKVNEPLNDRVEEAFVLYNATAPINFNSYALKELSYKSFKSILDLNVFTIAEWAALLQLSERTFHRYAKDNLSFNGILTERIELIHTLILEGLQLFGTQFKQWLQSAPYSLAGKKPIQILYTQEGILEVYKLMKRMQHGVVA